jgi:hypothetical protein
MVISSCPMCQTSIPSGEIVKACSACGSDLSRWTSKPALPSIIQTVGHGNQAVAEKNAQTSLGLGIAGVVLGACIGSCLMYGFYAMVGFRFPLLGVGIGFLTGLCAKKFNKSPDDRLGFAAGAFSIVAVVGTLYLMYGTFPVLSIISVILSASVAYRIASN